MSVMVVINLQASEGKAEELLRLLQHGRDVSRAAAGCEAFDVYRRQDDPNKFMFLERWTSIEDHHRNMQENILATGHLDRVRALIDGPIDNGVVELA